MLLKDFTFDVIHFDELPSTNIHAQEILRRGKLRHGEVICTEYQSQGKGQMSAAWESKPSENLLISICLRLNWPVDQLFQLTKCASLALIDLLDKLAVDQARIKWPNDILIGNKKVGGILIENSIHGQQANYTIFGIGLNVNQKDFEDYHRAASSLSMALGRNLDRKQLLSELLKSVKNRLNDLSDQRRMDQDYLNRLYGKHQLMHYASKGQKFKAELVGVDPMGKLILQQEGTQALYDLKEIQFLD